MSNESFDKENPIEHKKSLVLFGKLGPVVES
jgi:hypothetical protein